MAGFLVLCAAIPAPVCPFSASNKKYGGGWIGNPRPDEPGDGRNGPVLRPFCAGAGELYCGNLLISVRMRAPLPHI